MGKQCERNKKSDSKSYLIMEALIIFGLIIQWCLIAQLVMPLLLVVSKYVRKTRKRSTDLPHHADYAIIVTAYQQTQQLPTVVDSILKLNYSNYIVYIVADNCDDADLIFDHEQVVILRPPEVLASNVKSHFYAIRHFKRRHERLTIIDSDNLVDCEYLNELNIVFDKGFQAVQGVRKAKNLNTPYACLDEAGDIYYRMIDRKLLFEAGSSAALSGSGMAFNTALYRQCLEEAEISGAGFDKVLQHELLTRNHVIAFAESAIVFDEKTSMTGQLVKQRSRWINTWFKYTYLGWKLFIVSLTKPSLNRFWFSLMLLRPPLFMLVGIASICFIINLFLNAWMAVAWMGGLAIFAIIVTYSLYYFEADQKIYRSLISAPKFVGYQLLALLKAKKANKLSVATEHYCDKDNH